MTKGGRNQAAAILAMLFALGHASAAQATVLTFDGAFVGNQIVVTDDYGTYVDSGTDVHGQSGPAYLIGAGWTPNVALTWSGNWFGTWNALDPPGYGNLTGLVGLGNGNPGDTLYIKLTADAGYQVNLLDFWWADYPPAQTLDIRVFDSTNTEIAFADDTSSPTGAIHRVMSDLGWSTFTDTELTIQFSNFSFASNYWGLDNVSFSQTEIETNAVPEPSTWALSALGLAGLGIVSARRRICP